MFYLDYINDECSVLKNINNKRKRLKTSLIGDFNSYYGTNVDLLSLKMKIDIFKLDKKTLKKLDKIINIILEKNVLLSNNIIRNNNLREYLTKYFKLNGVNIVNNGKMFCKLYEIMVLDVLDEIVKKIGLPKNKLRIGIVINAVNQDFFYYLEKIGQEYKEVVIITKSEIRLENIIGKLYEEYGIVVIVNNKSLFLKSDIIINYGLNIDEKFIIGKCIVLDVRNNVVSDCNENDNIKLLDGIRIKGFYFDFDKSDFEESEYKCYFEFLDNFDRNLVYQSLIMKNTSYVNILNKIKQDGIQIKQLIGTNNVISVGEFNRYGNFLKNSKSMSTLRKK